MYTVLIVGGRSFTGLYLSQLLKDNGFNVVTTSKEISCGASHYQLDLLTGLGTEYLLRRINPDIVIVLAAITYIPSDNISEIYEINFHGPLSLLQQLDQKSNKPKKVIIASSAAVYAESSSRICEDSQVFPDSHYAASKFALETLAKSMTSLPIIVTRPFNYTGKGQRQNFLIPKLVTAFKTKQKNISLGNIEIYRDISDVRDVADAYLKIILHGKVGCTYNICSGRKTSIKEVVSHLQDLSNHVISINTDDTLKRQIDKKSVYGCPDRIVKLGWRPKFTLEKTLKWMMT